MMNNKRTTLLGVIFAAAFAFSGNSAATSVPWTGSSQFNDDTIYFTGFTTDSLTGIWGPGYYHSHDYNYVDVDLYIRLDNVWTNIFSDTTHNNAPHYLANIAGPGHPSPDSPINFAAGYVDALKWESDPGQTYTYHGLSTSTTLFHFNYVPVPEPATVLLLGLGLVGLGFAKRRVH